MKEKKIVDGLVPALEQNHNVTIRYFMQRVTARKQAAKLRFRVQSSQEMIGSGSLSHGAKGVVRSHPLGGVVRENPGSANLTQYYVGLTANSWI